MRSEKCILYDSISLIYNDCEGIISYQILLGVFMQLAFLAHNSNDKDRVRIIKRYLEKQGLQVWFDEDRLIPGRSYQKAIEEAILSCDVSVVFIGEEFGPVQKDEIESLVSLSQQRSNMTVIPVFLPGAKEVDSVFLSNRHWVQFNNGLDDENALYLLECGIRGVAPGRYGRGGVSSKLLEQSSEYNKIMSAFPRRDSYERQGDKSRIYEEPFSIRLVHIPAGDFSIGAGDDPLAGPLEKPQEIVHVPEFYISKHPITNGQFSLFLSETCYDPDGKKWRPNSDRNEFLEKFIGFTDFAMMWVKDKEFKNSAVNHPATEISWKDAVSFCRWFGDKSGEKARLPLEAEWEKAARGYEGRVFPWGNDFENRKLNCSAEEKSKGLTSIGQRSPMGDSFFGLTDMVGNVDEWCSCEESEYPYFLNSEKFRSWENEDEGVRRVLRGGSWSDGISNVRCSSRKFDSPRCPGENYGFRIVIES